MEIKRAATKDDSGETYAGDSPDTAGSGKRWGGLTLSFCLRDSTEIPSCTFGSRPIPEFPETRRSPETHPFSVLFPRKADFHFLKTSFVLDL